MYEHSKKVVQMITHDLSNKIETLIHLHKFTGKIMKKKEII